jgi:hypothetical protein
MTPQSCITGGGLTRKADRPVDTFGQISSAVKVQQKRSNIDELFVATTTSIAVPGSIKTKG